MPDKLRRLLGTYEFLNEALREHRRHLPSAQSNEYESSLEGAFLEILEHDSADLRVTIAQLRFLMSRLIEMSANADTAKILGALCERHLDRLAAEALLKAKPASAPTNTEFSYLDSLADRVAIYDADYRFKFTNNANAKFHGQDATDFVGRPSWKMTGEKFFEEISKPRFDLCLAGQSVSFITPHPTGDPSKLFAVNIDPVRLVNGAIDSFIVSCRDISNIPLPEERRLPAGRPSGQRKPRPRYSTKPG